MPLASLSIDATVARQALVYGRHLAGDGVEHTEYLCDRDLPVNVGKEMRRNVRMAAFPLRDASEHSVRFEGHDIFLSVADTGKTGDRDDLALRIRAPSYGAVDSFLEASRLHCERLVTAPRETMAIRRFLYSHGYWERLGDAPKRPPESVFLDRDARGLVNGVIRFMSDPEVKEKYNRFGVPFKMNVLLHGPPGTGKTSLIEAIAGRLGSDVFLVHFTDSLKDSDLAIALRKVCDHPSPIIVMEDVDCLFTDRKKHDSARNSLTMGGFLNALDGMSRPEGSVLFLTTNDAGCLDPAVTRTRRIDRVLRMTHATAEQSAGMIRSFFPDADVSGFCERTAFHPYTTAELSEYLFSCSGPPDGKEFVRWCRSRESSRERPASYPMYA